MSYVITGNPGVGKHTISKEISTLVHMEIVDINKIAQEFGLYEKNEETNDVNVEKLGQIIKENFTHPVLFVGHLAPYVLSSDKIKQVIVLRKNPYDLIPIYKGRGYSKEKITENLGSEALGIILHDTISQFGPEKTVQIDVTSQSIIQITKKILDVLKGEIKTEDVDWLTIISEKNDLKEFFAY
jgi:adenylate kinase